MTKKTGKPPKEKNLGDSLATEPRLAGYRQRKFLEWLSRYELCVRSALIRMDMTTRTLRRWLKDYPDFREKFEKLHEDHLRKEITGDTSLIEKAKLTLARAIEHDASIAVRMLESLEPEKFDRSIRKLMYEASLGKGDAERKELPRPVIDFDSPPEELRAENEPINSE